MGRIANLSLVGLYEWDGTLFDLFQIPEALDMEVLKANLLAESAELEILYPNPTVMKNLIGLWSHKNIDVWNRLYATTQYEYNPIENYNRNTTGSGTGSSTVTHTGKDTSTGTRTHGGSDTTEGTSKSEHYVAGYDSTPSGNNDGLVKQTRDEGEAETTTTYNRNEHTNDTKNHEGKDITQDQNSNTEHSHGNIGVTTTQKLIREQREVENFNLYDIIIKDFIKRFCIMIY